MNSTVSTIIDRIAEGKLTGKAAAAALRPAIAVQIKDTLAEVKPTANVVAHSGTMSTFSDATLLGIKRLEAAPYSTWVTPHPSTLKKNPTNMDSFRKFVKKQEALYNPEVGEAELLERRAVGMAIRYYNKNADTLHTEHPHLTKVMLINSLIKHARVKLAKA